jgi:ankyrin repeat protein
MSDRPKLFSPKPGSRGMDELQYAAYCGDLEAVQYWLAEGVDACAADDFGWTALHWNGRMACTPGERNAIIEALVAAGADVNQRDRQGKTVLDNAVEATAPEPMLDLLRSLGAT